LDLEEQCRVCFDLSSQVLSQTLLDQFLSKLISKHLMILAKPYANEFQLNDK
jgi:hypothetical protein